MPFTPEIAQFALGDLAFKVHTPHFIYSSALVKEGNTALCEMLKKAQEGNAFYADKESHTCEAGPFVLGQADAPGPFIGGEFGAGLRIFEDIATLRKQALPLYTEDRERCGELCCLFTVKHTPI